MGSPLWIAFLIAASFEHVTGLPALFSPVRVKSSEYLGNVTSTNSRYSRDLGFQGKVGNCYINSFGDDFLCNSQNPQKDCNFARITARNSCGRPTSPTTFEDIFLNEEGAPEQCVKNIGVESSTNPSGITNAVSTGPNSGIIYILAGDATVYDPTVSKTDTQYAGAGFATVEASDDCQTFKFTRTETNHWYGNQAGNGVAIYNEAYYGDHGALLAQDGLLYVYGEIPGIVGNDGASIALARVSPESAGQLSEYEYWNGAFFQKDRIYNPTAAIAVMDSVGQGSVFWNPYYGRYFYLTSYIIDVYVLTAPNPWGPWTKGANVFSVGQMPYRFEPAPGTPELFYSPAVQPMWSDEGGKELVFWTTYSVDPAVNDDGGIHEVITAVKVTFE